MSTTLHFQSQFISNYDTIWRVDIHHKTTEVSETTLISLGSPGFSINYKRLNDAILGGAMQSTCLVKFMVKDATELTFAHTILMAPNQNYYIKIYKNNVLFWGGWIVSGFDGYPDRSFPYVVNVKANDSIMRPLNKYNNQVDVTSQTDYKQLLHPFNIFETNYELDTIFRTSSKKWAFQTEFYNGETRTPTPSDINALRKTFYNRAAFVTDPENFPLTIEHFNTELLGVMKPFMLRLIQSAGKYWIQQAPFLDTANPNPIFANNASSISTDSHPGGGGYPVNSSIPITIDNTATPKTTNKGVILEGASYSLRPEAKSVRAKYIFGNNFCTFPLNANYTAGFVDLGYISQGQTNINLSLNVELRQIFPLTGSSAVTPDTYQASYITGVLSLKIKVGNKYLAHLPNSTGFYEFFWTTNDSTIRIFTGNGTQYENGPDPFIGNIESIMPFGGVYPYAFSDWENFEPSSSEATATSRFYIPGLLLPQLGSSFGLFQMQIIESETYQYFWTPDTPFGFFGNIGDWILNHNPNSSTNLNFNTSTNTPAQSTSKTINLGLIPFNSQLTIDEPETPTDNTPPIGAFYFASQSDNINSPDLNLGDLILGTSTSSNQITTLRALENGNFVNTGGFRSGKTGALSSAGQVLVNEYFKYHDESQIILSGTILSTSYEPHRTIIYQDKILGPDAFYLFGGGKFDPQAESWSGDWIKLSKTSKPFVSNLDDSRLF